VTHREIRVGLSASVSGTFQLQGQQALDGALLWQSHANTMGGICVNGGAPRYVRLIWYECREVGSRFFCCAHCARSATSADVKDRAA